MGPFPTRTEGQGAGLACGRPKIESGNHGQAQLMSRRRWGGGHVKGEPG
jgi:hypothetical protein